MRTPGPRVARAFAAGARGELDVADLLGLGRDMLAAINDLRVIAATDVPVLIVAEPGTGSEPMARAIHRASRRARHGFAALDGVALGARPNGEEVLDAALEALPLGGTLFVRCVEALPHSAQAVLGRLLDGEGARRLDRPGRRALDTRVISSVREDPQEVPKGVPISPWLYHRLGGFVVRLRPLRERRGEIPLLVQRFLYRARPMIRHVTPAAMQAFAEGQWPGNVEQLRRAVQDAALLCDGIVLDQRRAAFAIDESHALALAERATVET